MTLAPGMGEVAGLVNMVIRIEDFINDILRDDENRDFTLQWLDVETGIITIAKR